ncbi:MAG TPA: DNA polymerase domain-containing protein [Herpetosiphonaceae bacterium]
MFHEIGQMCYTGRAASSRMLGGMIDGGGDDLSVTQLTDALAQIEEEWLFGWNPTPGIVSIWAQREGHALVWQRRDDRVSCTRDQFRPWLFAALLDDLTHLGSAFAPAYTARRDTPVTYRELDGPADAYRFLISARPGYALERAILRGASQRLGRTIRSLYDLDESYYWVGPVEQYLMATGRVYFRGLTYADLHRLQFDLETTALDAERGRIFLIAVRDSRGLEITLEAPTPADEPRLIADLCALIRERDPDVIENHNLFGFDLPFLEQRAARLGVRLQLGRAYGPAWMEQYADPHRRRSSKRMRFSVAGRELIDTLDAVWRYDFAARDLPSYRLKDVARHFNVATAERVYIAGSAVFETYQTTPELTRRYALDDVAEVDALSQRLLGAAFALAGMAPRRFERLASAGPAMGILEPMLVRAYLHSGAALPRLSSIHTGAADLHEGGAVHLFATGIAEHVVKADVASLYPSLMRIYRIGPECDRLGVLLHLVNRLTDLRLAHKAAARTAAPGSLESGLHDANQAAMKILINSAYGYLGAGSMALFADRRAAGEVTRRGREILDQVVDGLRSRGMALLEADTDGVYFAVPADWTEQEERALVAEIGALLPDGIRLEYEGRYRAMFSYEVKNYALLTYDGALIMRGVALRSSRSEPFGERFLQRAMRCALLGDSAGVRAAFVETVAALRSRTLTAADVAARFRLSKTPEVYATTRASQREQQYEALLNAGRADWAAGERVRVYRAEGGAAVWIPDETEEGAPQAVGIGQDDHPAQRHDYDVEHYLNVLLNSYASRLRKAFAPEDFEQLFRLDEQLSLFDQPFEQIQPRWIRCR